MENLFKFANVSRPGIGDQRGFVLSRQFRGCPVETFGMQSEEMPGEGEQIGRSLAQGRYRHLPRREALPEAFVEVAGCDGQRQIDTGAGDQADVHRGALTAAEPQDASVGQDLDQLLLQRAGEVGDLVEIEAAPVGGTEPAHPTARGAGIGAWDIAKEFGRSMPTTERGAVEAAEQSGAAAALVEPSRQQFAPGAPFARQHHGGGARRQGIQVLEQLPRTRVGEGQGLGADGQGALLLRGHDQEVGGERRHGDIAGSQSLILVAISYV